MSSIQIASIELKLPIYFYWHISLTKLYLVDNLSANKTSRFRNNPVYWDQLKVIIGQQGLLLRLTMIYWSPTFCGDWNFYCQWPIFRHMITHFQELAFRILISILKVFNTDPFVFMKTIEQGLINLFFEFMRNEMLKRFPLGLTLSIS
jgi:hypothetical protein